MKTHTIDTVAFHLKGVFHAWHNLQLGDTHANVLLEQHSNCADLTMDLEYQYTNIVCKTAKHIYNLEMHI